MNWPTCITIGVCLVVGLGCLSLAKWPYFESVLPVKTPSLWIIASVVLPAISGVALFFIAMAIYAVETTKLDRMKRIYNETKLFFVSGVFYIVLGCFFLFTAFALLDQAHSTFLFLLAILGIAIVLYGTGTQGARSGNRGTLNVVIAGGAGVLALVFGFGIIQYNDDLQKVFKKTADYGILELNLGEASTDYQDYGISAELADGRLLHLWKKDQTVQMIIPIYGSGSKSIVQVSITPRIDVKDIGFDQKSFSNIYEIEWQSAQKVHGPANELILKKELTMQLRRIGVTITQQAEQLMIRPR